MSNHVPITQVPEIDLTQMEMDKSGIYFLISVRFDICRIEVEVKYSALVNHSLPEGRELEKLVEMVQGNRCQDIYHYIFQKYGQYMSMNHAAYLGKELKKAEIALALGMKDYYQE